MNRIFREISNKLTSILDDKKPIIPKPTNLRFLLMLYP